VTISTLTIPASDSKNEGTVRLWCGARVLITSQDENIQSSSMEIGCCCLLDTSEVSFGTTLAVALPLETYKIK
jgi:hypothetical protein